MDLQGHKHDASKSRPSSVNGVSVAIREWLLRLAKKPDFSSDAIMSGFCKSSHIHIFFGIHVIKYAAMPCAACGMIHAALIQRCIDLPCTYKFSRDIIFAVLLVNCHPRKLNPRFF